MLVTFLLLFCYQKIRNYSNVVYHVRFFEAEGLEVAFMENGRFIVRNSDFFEKSVAYGRYSIEGSKIILAESLRWGMSELNDTLIVSSDGLLFTLKEPWRDKSEGVLSYLRSPQ